MSWDGGLTHFLKGVGLLPQPVDDQDLDNRLPIQLRPELMELSEDLADITGIKTYLQDQHSPILDLLFHQILVDHTLASDAVVDTYTVTLTAGHGAIVGNHLTLHDSTGTASSQFEILGVAADIITLDSPMDHLYTTANTEVHISNAEMNVNGSVTPVVFGIHPGAGVSWDVTRIIIVIEDDAAMDFETFGGIAGLTNGCVVRIVNGEYNNLFNWKTNGELINRAFDHLFLTNVGGGNRGFTVRSTFNGQSKRGVTVRLDGATDDVLQVLVQDDLTALTKFRVIAQGHEVIP